MTSRGQGWGDTEAIPSGLDALPVLPTDDRLRDWYHTIELAEGLVTDGYFDLRPVVHRYGIPESLAGKTALDVGTGDGFFAFELERRGAERVTAIDLPNLAMCDWVPRVRAKLGGELEENASWPVHFRLAHAMLGSRVDYRFLSVYDLSPERLGVFDVVFCGSLLLHLQNPLAALVRIRSVTREMAIIETAIDPLLERESPDRPLLFFGSMRQEEEPGEDNTFWLFTTAALIKMLEYANFSEIEPQGTFDLSPLGPTVTSVVARVHPTR